MNSKTFNRLFAILLMLMAGRTYAQPGVWNKIEAQYNLTKKLQLEGNIQARTNEMGEPIKAWIGELGLGYDLPKGFSVSAWYRFIGEPKESYTRLEKYHRFYGELKYKTKLLNPLRVSYRFRYQQQFKDDSDGLELDADYMRNKLGISLKNKTRFEPYASADLFYKVGNGLDQVRYKTGLETKINRWSKLDLGIQTDDRLNSNKSNQWRLAWALKFKLN